MRFDRFLEYYHLRWPERLAVVDSRRRLTFRELDHRVWSISGELSRRRVGCGNRVVLFLPNRVEFVEAFFAVLRLGGVVVPVSTRMSVVELGQFCDDCSPRIVITLKEYADRLNDIHVEKYFIDDSSNEMSLDDASHFASCEQALGRREDACLIMYTSGTTGAPKGVVHTHEGLLLTAGHLSAVEWGLSKDDIFLVATPLANRTGIGRLTNFATLGATLVILEEFKPERLLDIVSSESITVMGLVPTMCRRLIRVIKASRQRYDSLRTVLVTGEAFPAELKRQMMDVLPNVRILSYYGMTECGAVSLLHHDEQQSHALSVGRPLPHIQIRLRKDNGEVASAGEVGEILVRGELGKLGLMKEYLGRMKETEESLVDGWFATGDLGKLDEDGYLYIVDRSKDMIVSGGFNIYSKEIEQIALESSGVNDAAVVGVPDEKFGEAVVLFLEIDARSDSKQIENAVSMLIAEKLASYKKPKRVITVLQFPRNLVGKVRKEELRSIAVSRAQI